MGRQQGIAIHANISLPSFRTTVHLMSTSRLFSYIPGFRAAQAQCTPEFHRKLAIMVEFVLCQEHYSILTICLLRFRHVELAETKIAQRNMTRVIQEDVLWLQITMKDFELDLTYKSDSDHVPINNIETVQMLQCT